MFYGLLSRCLAGAPPDKQGHVTDDDVRIFLSVREYPEPLYFWASDLAYCGHPKPAMQLLRESIRRNFCATAIESDPIFAAIRNSAEYGELLAARPGMPSAVPRACRDQRLRRETLSCGIGCRGGRFLRREWTVEARHGGSSKVALRLDRINEDASVHHLDEASYLRVHRTASALTAGLVLTADTKTRWYRSRP